LWDTRGWRQVGVLNQADVSDLSFAADGKTLATANGIEVTLWNVEARTQIASVPPSQGRSHPRQVAFAPDGHTLAVADANGVLIYWDYENGIEEAGWRAHRPNGDERAMEDLSFSPVGRMLATAGDDRSIRLWTAPQRFRPLSNHADVVTCVTFSRDGRTLLSSGMDQTVRWWEVATQRELQTWQAHPGGALRVRFAPDGRSFASSGVDGTIKLWRAQRFADESPVRPLPSKIQDLVVLTEPPLLALSLGGRKWSILRLPGLEEIQQGQHSTSFDASLKGIGNGRIVECSGPIVQFQRVKDGGIEPFITSDLGDVLGAEFSRDGRTIAVSAVNGLSVWDVPRKQEIRRWSTPREGRGRHVRISPDASRVVTLHNQDGALAFFDVASGRKASVAGEGIGSAVLGFSIDGRLLATAARGAPVRVYDVGAVREVSAFEPTGGAVAALAFSPDARRVACGSSKGLITLWDLETRREVAVLTGHVTMIYSMAFLDSDTLVSATGEEVRFWRAPGLNQIQHQSESLR
jgi:WD40 repeat protein